jgi:outer membrane immunogenic protein
MRRSLLLSAALAAFAGPAFAADFTPGPPYPPYQTPVVAAPTWTGCYVGGSVGGGFGQTTMTDDNGFVAPPGSSASTSTSGVVGGGQVGCNYQFYNLLVGAEVQLLASGVDGSANVVGRGGPETISSNTDWLTSVTGRVGWGWNSWLLYAKGGAAWAHDNYQWNAPFADLTDSEGRFGWTVGAGVEWAFWYHWSVRLEYDFYDFGTQTFTFGDSLSGLGTPIDVKNTINAVTVGLNYRFGGGY